MIGILEVVLFGVFLFFYIGLFYNLPVLVVGVRDLLRSRRGAGKRASAGSGVLPSFSIILPVKNEKRVVGRSLEALSQLNYPVDKFEVVVVDDGSDDGTTDICRDFAASHGNVKLLHRSFSEGKASALNHGLRNSSGEIVVIFDADNVPASDVLSLAAGYFEDSSVAAVQGRIDSINHRENMLTQFIAYEDFLWCEAFLRGKDALGLFVHLRGCCEFVRRSVLDDVGGSFDEGVLAEDIEISARFVEGNHKIKYVSDIRVWQETPSNLKSFLKQRTRWFRGHMEIAFRYGRLFKNLNRRTLDAEFTLALPFVAIASFICFTFASWGLFSPMSSDVVLSAFLMFSNVTGYVIFLVAGFALIYYSKPKSVKNLLWLPFVFCYWCLQSFLAVYALVLIVLRRPRMWVKTEKSGAVASQEFALEILKAASTEK
jgi:cellulose synthase/poly-beta-1,6-N-acetylglucosamine synthase-like glycosyltransferase